jgi:hypothetical protein
MFSAHRGRRLVFRNGKVVWSCRLAAIFERVDSVHRFLRADLRTPAPQLLFGLMTSTVLRLRGSRGAGEGALGEWGWVGVEGDASGRAAVSVCGEGGQRRARDEIGARRA